MRYDVIILSKSDTNEHIDITKNCIRSLLSAKNKIGVNIYVIESHNKNIKYNGAKTIYWVGDDGFNYNQALNYGISISKEEYVFCCNNDLVFGNNWADNCYYVFAMGYESVSPYCSMTHPRFTPSGDFLISGYQVGFHIAGWCIGVKRDMIEKLGGFNTAVNFWYSDNIYCEQIKIARVKHALVCNSFVTHLDFGSQTLNTLEQKEKTRLTSAQRKVFNNEVKKLYKNG